MTIVLNTRYIGSWELQKEQGKQIYFYDSLMFSVNFRDTYVKIFLLTPQEKYPQLKYEHTADHRPPLYSSAHFSHPVRRHDY